MPSGTLSSRSGPSKHASNAWSARWPSSAVPRKLLNSVPGSGNQEDRRCVVCLSYHAPSDLHMQRLFRVHAVHTKLKFPRKVLNTTIRMWCCQARVHMACILQSMHSLYGRANKHLWRCVHCRRYLMDSQEEDIFHIRINDVDSFDSDDNQEIEHVHRIHEVPLDQSSTQQKKPSNLNSEKRVKFVFYSSI